MLEIHSYIQAYLISRCQDMFFCFLTFFVFTLWLCYIFGNFSNISSFFHYYYICHCDQLSFILITKDVLKAQMMLAFLAIKYFKLRYVHFKKTYCYCTVNGNNIVLTTFICYWETKNKFYATSVLLEQSAVSLSMSVKIKEWHFSRIFIAPPVTYPVQDLNWVQKESREGRIRKRSIFEWSNKFPYPTIHGQFCSSFSFISSIIYTIKIMSYNIPIKIFLFLKLVGYFSLSLESLILVLGLGERRKG